MSRQEVFASLKRVGKVSFKGYTIRETVKRINGWDVYTSHYSITKDGDWVDWATSATAAMQKISALEKERI